MDVVQRRMVGMTRHYTEGWTNVMAEQPKKKRRGIRRNVWVNAAVLLLLLVGGMLGIMQAFILLAIYALVIAPA